MSDELLTDRILKLLLADITDRCGLKQAWASIDKDILDQELLPTWRQIIEQGFADERVKAIKEVISVVKATGYTGLLTRREWQAQLRIWFADHPEILKSLEE